MERLSNRAIDQRAQDAADLEYQTKRDHVKQTLMTAVVVLLWIVGLSHHAEIRDTIAKLFERGPMEFQSILKMANDPDGGKDDDPQDTTGGGARKARLREAMKRAKDHAAEADNVMDDKAP